MSSQEPKTPTETKAPEQASGAASETPTTKTSEVSASAKEKARKFQNKNLSEFYDPCQEAAQASYRCLFRNGGDKSMCGDYFQAYRDCKQAWTEERKKKTGAWF